MWIVAIKATFALATDGRLSMAEEQPLPLLAPEWRGEPGLSSLRYDAELTAPKPATDVVLNGAAHARGGRAERAVEVGLQIGGIEKRLRVHGPRAYRRAGRGVALSEAKPFVRQELSYELAFGGMDLTPTDPSDRRIDARNPVGRGIFARGRDQVDQPAHQIEYVWGQDNRPGGFGPIASHWSPRLELQGTYDEAWSRTRHPLLPVDYDAAALLSAPVDQRPTEHLVGGEPMVLHNLTPSGYLAFRLPTLRFTVTTNFGARRIAQAPVMSSVVIEPELGQLAMVWQSSLEVGPRALDDLDASVVEELA